MENLKTNNNQFNVSPVKALEAAGKHIVEVNFNRRINDVKSIIVLVHDGHNTDSIAETLEAT